MDRVIKKYRYNDNMLHWEKYEERFIKRNKRLYDQCKEAGIRINFDFNPNNSMMTVTLLAEDFIGKEWLVEQVSVLDY